MRDYELMVIIHPEVGEEDLPGKIEGLTQLITARGGEIAEVKEWGRRKLAYSIRQCREGNYVLAHFKLEPDRASELEASLLVSEDILRHLLVKLNG